MMKRLLSLLLLFALVVAPASTVFAQGAQRANERREAAQEKSQEARERAKEKVAEIKADAQARRLEIKQEVCERRSEKMAAVMPKMATGAVRVKTVIDTMFDRVQSFYESGQLTVENYDELVANIETAKAEAEVAMTAVDEYEFDVDCENEDVGQKLDAYRLLVRNAKDSLKEYRSELVALISALKSEAAEQDNTEDNETSESEVSDDENTETTEENEDNTEEDLVTDEGATNEAQ